MNQSQEFSDSRRSDSSISDRVRAILSEGFGGTTGFNPGDKDTPGLVRLKDAKRKQRERQGEQRIGAIQRARQGKMDEEEIIDPKSLLNGPMRLSLKETFLKHIIDYLEENKKSHLFEALDLMEDYPQLKTWVHSQSLNALPHNHFPIYAVREALDEEVGSIAQRSGEEPKIWFNNKNSAVAMANTYHEHYIMEAKVSPDKTLIYIPAFSKMLEQMITEGKVPPPTTNILRKARSRSEILLPGNVNEGLVIHVKKRA
jgi:hypothetical protein